MGKKRRDSVSATENRRIISGPPEEPRPRMEPDEKKEAFAGKGMRKAGPGGARLHKGISAERLQKSCAVTAPTSCDGKGKTINGRSFRKTLS